MVAENRSAMGARATPFGFVRAFATRWDAVAIRTNQQADGMADFDAVLRDPALLRHWY